MKLYMSPLSPNARKVRMAADLLDLALETEVVDLRSGANQKPEYLRINPMGKVPTLVDGDFILWESHAIMQYLADKKPGNTLYPADGRARADVNRWLFWASTHWSPNVSMLMQERVMKKMRGAGDPDASIVAWGEREVTRFGKVADDHLKGRDYLCGSAVTLADLAVASPLALAVPAGLPITGYSNLQRWLARIQGMDAWKKTAPPPL